MHRTLPCLFGLIAGCASPLPERGDCNPVDPAHCLLPFPSGYFLEHDAATGTSQRVAFGPTSLPSPVHGVQTSPELWNHKDGFPILGGAYAHLGPATVDGLPSLVTIDDSLSWDSPTLWVNLDTGELHPHWVELDEPAESDDEHLMVLRPAVAMDYGTRYAIALRGVVDSTGEVLPTVEPFRLLRDGDRTDDPDLRRQRDVYEDVLFPVLEERGVDLGELQQAWEFTTVSTRSSLGPVLHLRDEALAWATAGIPYTLRVLEEGDCEAGDHIALDLDGEMTVPLYLDHAEASELSRLVRDDDSYPVQQGTYQVSFTLRIPCSVWLGEQEAKPVQLGHGLFVNHTFARHAFWAELLDAEGVVLYAQTWTGMCSDDLPLVGGVISEDFTNFAFLPERLHQGQLEVLLGPAMLRQLDDDPLLQLDGAPLFDGEAAAYIGSSQGSIAGGANFAMSTDYERAVFVAPGMPYSLLLPRASLFSPFFVMLDANYDGHDAALTVPLMGMLWEPVEAAGWAPFITGRPVDDLVPTKRALLVDAIGDASVSTVGARVYARSVHAGLPEPAPRSVWGLDSVTLPTADGSVLIEVDYGLTEPDTAVPCSAQDNPHHLPLRDPVLFGGMIDFLRTGVITMPCDGVCDPN